MDRQNQKTIATAAADVANTAFSGDPAWSVCDGPEAAQLIAVEARALGVEAVAVVVNGAWVVKAPPCRLAAVG